MKFRNITIFLWIYILYGTCGTTRETLDYLVKNLQQKTQTRQVLLLHDDSSKQCGLDEFVKNISRLIPTRIANFSNHLEDDTQLRFYLQQETTIVVIPKMNAFENSTLLSKMLNIAELLHPKPRPKVLIVYQSSIKRANYVEFFQLLWSNQFLDVTITELTLRQRETKIFAECFRPKTIYLHYYNPFSNRSFRIKLSENSILFPNKLRNMSGYKMRVKFFHYPPYVYYVSDNSSSGHVESIYGPDVNLILFYSNVMNFTLEKVTSNTRGWNKVYCSKEDNNASYGDLIYNSIQLTGVQIANIKTCLAEYTLICKGTRMLRFIFAVPILPSEVQIIITNWNLQAAVNIICLILLPWTMAKFLKFDNKYWNMMYVLRMVLCFTMPKEPVKLVERIVFLTMTVFYFLQSSSIFTTFSNLQLQRESFRKIENFQDLLATNLQTITHKNGMKDDGINDDDAYNKIVKNIILSKKSFDDCIETLVDHQNVSCVGREDSALLIIKSITRKRGQLKIKFLKEIEGIWPSGFLLAGGSPYFKRFEELATALLEAGISNKWDSAFIPKESSLKYRADLKEQENSLTSKALILMVILVLVGYSFSFLVFIAEIIIHVN